MVSSAGSPAGHNSATAQSCTNKMCFLSEALKREYFDFVRETYEVLLCFRVLSTEVVPKLLETTGPRLVNYLRTTLLPK